MHDRRVALITGAGSGIGSAVARRLVSAGYAVVAADRDEASVRSLVASIQAETGESHRSVRMDVSDEREVVDGHAEIESTVGPIAVLVTAAGVFPPSGQEPAVAGTSADDWAATERVNGFGTFVNIREMLRARRATPVADGRIVTFTSIGAQVGVVRATVAYAASKAAVMGITRCAAKEGAPLGVTANCIAPGFVSTPMLEAAFTPDALTALAQSVPVGRLGRADEVAALVEFLAGPEAGYITGTTIDINGGSRIGT